MPENDDGCAKWLYKLYEEKDELVDGFIKNQRFPGEQKPFDTPIQGMLLSLAFLFFYTFPVFHLILSMILSLPTFALYTSALGLLIGLFVFVCVHFFVLNGFVLFKWAVWFCIKFMDILVSARHLAMASLLHLPVPLLTERKINYINKLLY